MEPVPRLGLGISEAIRQWRSAKMGRHTLHATHTAPAALAVSRPNCSSASRLTEGEPGRQGAAQTRSPSWRAGTHPASPRARPDNFRTTISCGWIRLTDAYTSHGLSSTATDLTHPSMWLSRRIKEGAFRLLCRSRPARFEAIRTHESSRTATEATRI